MFERVTVRHVPHVKLKDMYCIRFHMLMAGPRE